MPLPKYCDLFNSTGLNRARKIPGTGVVKTGRNEYDTIIYRRN
jgi:hypothetical protein